MERPPPDLYQPQLRWWSHLWRIAAALFIGGLAWSTVAKGQTEEFHLLFWLDIALGVVALVLMHFRRRWPLPIAVAVTLLGFLSAWSVGAGTVVAVSLATRRRWPEILAVGALGIAVGQAFVVVQPVVGEAWWLTLGTNLTFTVAIMAIGMYIGSRRELLWTLRERADRAEAEQELRVAQARSNERARIAREMHDVLAHRISLVTMHSGALTYRTDLSRDEVAHSAEIIQSSAHQALVDLRHVLGVLRGDDTEPAKDRPQPTFAEVPALVDEAARSGMHVDYEESVSDADAVPDQVGRTVYRIVQEGLTNARKHAPSALVTVTISGDQEHGVEVRVQNLLLPGGGAGAPGSGLGLVGLAERAELAGGTLEHESDRRSFTLRGWLPWEA